MALSGLDPCGECTYVDTLICGIKRSGSLRGMYVCGYTNLWVICGIKRSGSRGLNLCGECTFGGNEMFLIKKMYLTRYVYIFRSWPLTHVT